MLRVCKLSLCSPDFTEVTQLETSLQILSLVSEDKSETKHAELIKRLVLYVQYSVQNYVSGNNARKKVQLMTKNCGCILYYEFFKALNMIQQ